MPKEDPFVNRAQLLKAIKKYPEIWDSNNKLHMCRSVTSPMWTEIAEQFGGHVPTGECDKDVGLSCLNPPHTLRHCPSRPLATGGDLYLLLTFALSFRVLF